MVLFCLHFHNHKPAPPQKNTTQLTNTSLCTGSKRQTAAGSRVGHSQSGWIFHMAADDAVNYRWQDKAGSLASIRRGQRVSDLHGDCQCRLHTTQGRWQWEGPGSGGQARVTRDTSLSLVFGPAESCTHASGSANTHTHTYTYLKTHRDALRESSNALNSSFSNLDLKTFCIHFVGWSPASDDVMVQSLKKEKEFNVFLLHAWSYLDEN